MDLHIQGNRPSSARPQSRMNPITGEEMPYTPRTPRQDSRTYEPSRQNRPEGVPSLDLGAFRSRDEEKDFTFQFDEYKKNIHTPNTSSTLSLGTPVYNSKSQFSQRKQQKVHDIVASRESSRSSSQRTEQHRPTPKHQTAWDKQPVSEEIPPPSQRHKEQYQQYEKEMKDGFRKKSHVVTEDEIGHKIESLKLDMPLCPSEEDASDDSRAEMQKSWTQQPYTKAALHKKSDWEHLEEEKKKNKLIETVMIDQLSRAVIACPEQNKVPDLKAQAYRPGMRRGTVRTMHDSKVKTSGTATENLLSRRVRFGARVLSTVGRDAIRELTGFFFAIDNSLTIYEFRQFGKSAKALPFIKRGAYEQISGKHSGEQYQLAEISPGRELEFETVSQPLPDSIKQTSHLKVKITDVDDETKATILLDGISPSERQEIWQQLHLPTSREELKSRVLMQQIQALVRKQIKKRGVKVFTGIGRMLRRVTKAEGGAKLNKYELEKTLCDFHIDVPNEMFDDHWEYLDSEGSSFLHYDEFMRGFLGEMSEKRKPFVRKAFRKVDAAKQGTITVDEMKKFYNANKHPKVRSGECSEGEILQMFMSNFVDTKVKGEVTFEEFTEYYEGLSVCIEDDNDFENILKNAWSI